MGSLWAKYILFELKKIQRSNHSWNWRRIQNLDRNRLVVSKLAQGIWQNLTWTLESLENFHFNGFFMSKVYIAWAKKVPRNNISWLKNDTKFGEESTCRLKIDIKNLTNFDLSTWKSQKFSFLWAPFGQSIYCLS